MKAYKIGNKINCIIRNWQAENIGNIPMKYKYEPYTTFSDIEAIFNFESESKIQTQGSAQLAGYQENKLASITFNNVPITNRIVNMLFNNRNEGLVSHVEVVKSDDQGRIFFKQGGNKYQVFIYNKKAELEQSFGEVQESFLQVNERNSTYNLVYYTISNEVYSLQSRENLYVSMDIELIGNDAEDNTMSGSIHIDKALLNTTPQLNFNRYINTVNLTFTVVYNSKEDNNNYIILNS